MLVYAWRHHNARGSNFFALLCLFAVFWMFGDIVGISSNSFAGDYIGEVFRYVGGVFLPVTLLIFVLQYCGRDISRKAKFKLLVIPVISYLMMVTTIWHKLFFANMQANPEGVLLTKFGLYFWYIHTPYSYVLILSSIFIVFLELTRTTQRYRTQLIFLVASIFLLLSLNFVGLLDFLDNVYLTPLSFSIFLFVTAIGIYRYDFLDGNPIAYETVFQKSRDGVVILNKRNIVVDINKAATKGIGVLSKDVLGKEVTEAFPHWIDFLEKFKDSPKVNEEIEAEIDGEKKFYLVTMIPIDDGSGNLSGKIVNIRDVSIRKENQKILEDLAFHDPLTRLGNRRKFDDEFNVALKKSKKNNDNFAILYFDINRFKHINDTMGHEIGDELLKYVAARIASILRKSDTLARVGGDEFAAIFYNANEQDIEIAAERILHITRQPFKVKDHIIKTELSIGAAFYPKDGDDLNKLLNNADTAMYKAKSNGGGLHIFNYKESNPSETVGVLSLPGNE